jgi:hypothetical protein
MSEMVSPDIKEKEENIGEESDGSVVEGEEMEEGKQQTSTSEIRSPRRGGKRPVKPSDLSSTAQTDTADTDTATGSRTASDDERKVQRRVTGDGINRRIPPSMRKPVSRSISGDPTNNELQQRMLMKQNRATNSRDFGRPGGGAPGRGLTRGGLAGTQTGGVKSMSTRFLDRMASTRAMFNLDSADDEPDPHIIIYMGREINGADLFDEEWIQDALNEGLNAMGNSFKQQQSLKSVGQSKTPQVSNNLRDGKKSSSTNDESSSSISNSNEEHDDGDSSASEVEEPMEKEPMHDASNVSNSSQGMDCSSNQRKTNRRLQGRRTPNNIGRERPLRSKSSNGINSRAPQNNPGPRRKIPNRSKTFDGTKTSEILPRRRKPKVRDSITRINKNQREDLLGAFHDFLAKGGAVVASGRLDNNFLLTQTEFPTHLEPRRKVRPASHKKQEQFKKLEYTPQDINAVLFEDDETFQRLKRVLTKKGAITNGVLQQRLHIFLKKAKDRHSKLIAQRKEHAENGEGSSYDDDDNNPNTNLQSTQPDWAAMSMMDMFAQSMRKLTVGDGTDQAPATDINTNSVPSPKPGAPPAFKRRALPRQQILMSKVKESRMQAAKKSAKMLMIAVEEDEDDGKEDRSAMDDSKASTASHGSFKDTSSDRPPARSLTPKTRNPPVATSIRVAAPATRKISADSTVPLQVGSCSQEVELDVLMLQPKCLDDELTGCQRPMELNLSQTFQHPPELLIKCLDDASTSGGEPLQLDLTGMKTGKLLVEPKYKDDSSNRKTSSKMRSSSGRSSSTRPPSIRMMSSSSAQSIDGGRDRSKSSDGGRDRRRRGPRRQPSSDSGPKSGDIRGSRRTSSYDQVPPALQIKCLDDEAPPPIDTSSSSSRTPPPPGLLVGWNH